MGYRTVVMLNNDQAHEWQHDAELGQKISRAMNHSNGGKDPRAEVGGYGRVVECAHADNQTLAVLDGYTTCEIIAQEPWHRGELATDVPLKLLKAAARALGYQVVKRPDRATPIRRTAHLVPAPNVAAKGANIDWEEF